MENETLHLSILISEGPLRIKVSIKFWANKKNLEIHDTIGPGAVKDFKRNGDLVQRKELTYNLSFM